MSSKSPYFDDLSQRKMSALEFMNFLQKHNFAPNYKEARALSRIYMKKRNNVAILPKHKFGN